MTTVLAGAGVITIDGISAPTDVVVSDGLIVALAPAGSGVADRAAGDVVIDVGGKLLAPGFIDLQLNGGWGHDFTTDAESIATVAARLPATGVTSFLPTIVTASAGRRRAALDEVAALHDRPATDSPAAVLGLHFEGPLINAERSGAHDRVHVGPPDPAELASWSRSAGVAVVTIAPEVAGALAVAAQLAARDVVVAAGHTACTAEQFAAGRRAGVTLVTHLFNAMAPFEHRNPGPVGATLADPLVSASLICDGIHVDPVAVRMAWNALGPGRTILVTDATAALGIAADAVQRLGGVEIIVSGDRLETADGTLAGSNLTLDKAVRNLISFVGCSIADAIRTVTANPAQLLGLSDRGTIEVGARADLVVLDHDLHVERTLVGGVTAWRRDPTDTERSDRSDRERSDRSDRDP